MEDLLFSVILPTYKRRELLRLVLEGLSYQSHPSFEVLAVVKSTNDGTENLIENYRAKLDIRLITQQTGYVTDALNLGMKNARGNAFAFIDDDAIPAPDWLERHAETYEALDVAGVAGDAIPSRLVNGKPKPSIETAKVPFSRFLSRLSYSTWEKPLPNTQGYFIYVTCGGAVSLVGNYAYWRNRGMTVNSFLGMGANLTVLSKAIQSFSFDCSWISGSRWEQFLAWHIWRSGGRLVFNPTATVFHISHGQTLSRDLATKKAKLFQAENELLFYRLCGKEKSLSHICHGITVLHRIFAMLKNKDLQRLNGVIVGNSIGIRRLILRRARSDVLVLQDLKALQG
jgi:glycosyltransferase involved in cell wall biosynthesis